MLFTSAQECFLETLIDPEFLADAQKANWISETHSPGDAQTTSGISQIGDGAQLRQDGRSDG